MNVLRRELPADLAERLPRSVKDDESGTETVHVDGQSFTRRLPSATRSEFLDTFHRPPGMSDARLRLDDLDGEAVWAEVVYPSLGMWNGMIRDRRLAREGASVANVWAFSEIPSVAGNTAGGRGDRHGDLLPHRHRCRRSTGPSPGSGGCATPPPSGA